jgi:hypothetical protein
VYWHTHAMGKEQQLYIVLLQTAAAADDRRAAVYHLYCTEYIQNTQHMLFIMCAALTVCG